MWSDANLITSQQRIIKRHLRYYFGKRIFLAENAIATDYMFYSVPPFYGEYKHYKDGDKSQKPEKCTYWSRNALLVVKADLEGLLDYSNLDVESNNLYSLANVNGRMLVVGADQGQGAWRSWIKIPTMPGAERRKRIDNDASYQPKNLHYCTSCTYCVQKRPS
jgi:hypothetical protein